MSQLVDRIICVPLTSTWLEACVEVDGTIVNFLDTDALANPSLPTGKERSVIWSGGLGAARFEADPRSWLATGWSQFEQAVKSLPHATMLRPHAAHVLSDALSCRRLAESESDVSLALAPASMMADSMRNELDDHLHRIFELAAPHASMLILEDLATSTLAATHAGEGVLSGPLLAHLIETFLPGETPIIVAASDRAAAIGWLCQ
jgi:hypothetical protein